VKHFIPFKLLRTTGKFLRNFTFIFVTLWISKHFKFLLEVTYQ